MTEATPLAIVYRRLADLRDDPRNTKTHSDDQIDLIARSIEEFGPTNPILVDETDQIIAGHARKAAGLRLGLERFPTITLAGLTADQRRAYVIADNRLAEVGAAWDVETLRMELADLSDAGFDLSLVGFDLGQLDTLGELGGIGLGLPSPAGAPGEHPGGRQTGSGSLAEKFGIPPFSVLNAREGWWQDRKRAWIGLGIKSELGRGEGATYDTEQITSPGLNFYRDQAKASGITGGSMEPMARARAGKPSTWQG